MNQVHVKRASLFYLVFVMYSYTTGGPFGLEAEVSTTGPGMALISISISGSGRMGNLLKDRSYLKRPPPPREPEPAKESSW